MTSRAGLGSRATLALVGCFVVQMGLGAGYVFGVTLKHIVSEFEWSRFAFAASSAPLLLAMALASPVVGNLTERLGARAVVSSATVLLGIALWLFSQMESLWQFYATSVLFGIGLTGVGDIVAGAVASRWVTARRGLALAVVYVGSNVGGAIVPVAAESIAAADSWRTALQVIGLGLVVVILPFALTVVREPPPDYQPPGELLEGDDSDDTLRDREGERDIGLAEALRTRSFWVLAFVLFSFYFYYLAVNQHLVAFLSDMGFSDARAAASLSFAVALGIVSKLGIGLLADRIPVRAALLLNFGVLAVASFLLLGIGVPALLPVFLVAHGFATAAENVLLPLVVAYCFGLRHLAQIYGALMVTLFPGGVLGPMFAGAVFDATGGYGLAFTTFALLNVVALASLLLVRSERRAGAGAA